MKVNSESFFQKQEQRKEKQKKAFEIKKRRATKEKGLLMVYTGQGKGKSTAAFGMLLRSVWHQLNCAVIQFVKGKLHSTEYQFFSTQQNVKFFVAKDGFTWLNKNIEEEIEHANFLWEKAKKWLSNDAYDFIVLDEINIMLHYEYINIEDVLLALQNRPAHQHVVLTGRHAPESLLNISDLVSKISMHKHPYQTQGIKAQKGVEY